MKRVYERPETWAVKLLQESQLLANTITPDPTRNVGGGPTNNGVPGTVGETSEDNPGYGYGQGDPNNPIGGGNRGKEFDLWDMSSFDVWN